MLQHGLQDRNVPWQQAMELGTAVGVSPLLRNGPHGERNAPWSADSTVQAVLQWARQ